MTCFFHIILAGHLYSSWGYHLLTSPANPVWKTMAQSYIIRHISEGSKVVAKSFHAFDSYLLQLF